MNHDCQDILKDIYAFLDGEMSGDDAAHIKSHIENCSPCLEAFDFHAELQKVVHNRCRDVAPDELKLKIRNALLEQSGSE